MRIENPLFWLQNYCRAFDAQNGKPPRVVIKTIDNPGWRLQIELPRERVDNFKEVKVDRSEEEWLFAKVDGDRFEGACGATNLEELIGIFKGANFQITVECAPASESLKNPLHWLMGWYLFNCDGDWEHSHGIRFNLGEDGSWHVEIDLDDTILESEMLIKRQVALESAIVYEVWIEEKCFRGKGSIGSLENIINDFRSFSEIGIEKRR